MYLSGKVVDSTLNFYSKGDEMSSKKILRCVELTAILCISFVLFGCGDEANLKDVYAKLQVELHEAESNRNVSKKTKRSPRICSVAG